MNFDLKPVAWLGPLLQPLKPLFREVATSSLFVNLLALAAPVFVLQVYDRVVQYSGIATLKGLAIGMAVAISFDFLLRQGRSRMLQRIALKIDVEVGRRLFDKLTALPLRVLESKPGAYWQALFRDLDVVRNSLSGAAAVLVFDLPFAVLFLGFIFVIAAPIAWVILLILPVFVFLALRSGRTLNAANESERLAAYSRDAMIAEMVANRGSVKALALERSLKPIWEDRFADTVEHSMRRGGQADSFVNMGTGLAVFTTVLVTTVGALAIIDQRLSIGALIATNMLSMRIVGPFQQLVGMWRNFAQARLAATRLGEVFALAEDRRESAVALAKPKGELVLDGVTFKYAEDGPPAIDNVSLKIAPGGLHAIIGANGCGKTTLLKLIQGLYPPETGRVLLDGADIAQFSRHDLVDWIGYLPQQPAFFAGSVRDNIAQGTTEASDEDVIAAATLAGVHAHIVDLPDGYGCQIGEAGARLSNGMRQRLALARTLIGDPPVLLLDEPSNNLDQDAEDALRELLVGLARDRTVILVSHRPALLAASHNVMVLEKGKAVAAGATRKVLPQLFQEKAPAGLTVAARQA